MQEVSSFAGWPRELRALRAQRPGRIAKGARADVFGVCLEQAEQLWNASARVDTVAAPLLLFYGLGQAGRALAAAALPDNKWRPRDGHGLDFVLTKPASGELLDLGHVTVSPRGIGLVHSVADALDSPVLAADTSFTSLLASLGTLSFATLTEPSPLDVTDNWSGSNARDEMPASIVVGYTPDAWGKRLESRRNELGEDYKITPEPTIEEIIQWLRPYPKLSTLGPPNSTQMRPMIFDGQPWGVPHHRNYICLEWREPLLTWKTSPDWVAPLLDLDTSTVGHPRGGTVFPAVGSNDRAQHPLVGWWLVLYGFSMLARYHPQEWMGLLNVDRSPVATSIEGFMEEARDMVPALLHDALVDLSPGEKREVSL